MGKYYTYVPGAEFPYQYKYEHMAVTTDCVIFTYRAHGRHHGLRHLHL